MMNIFFSPFFFSKKGQIAVKPSQRNKKLNSLGKYIKKIILREVLTSDFRVSRQKKYKSDKKPDQF